MSIFHFTCESAFFSTGGSEVITVRDVWIEVEAQWWRLFVDFVVCCWLLAVDLLICWFFSFFSSFFFSTSYYIVATTVAARPRQKGKAPRLGSLVKPKIVCRKKNVENLGHHVSNSETTGWLWICCFLFWSQADSQAKEELQRWRSRKRRQVEAGFDGADGGGVCCSPSWQLAGANWESFGRGGGEPVVAIAEASRASISLSLSVSLFFCETLCVSSPPLFAYGILKTEVGSEVVVTKLHPFRHVESFDGAPLHDPLGAGSGVWRDKLVPIETEHPRAWQPDCTFGVECHKRSQLPKWRLLSVPKCRCCEEQLQSHRRG